MEDEIVVNPQDIHVFNRQVEYLCDITANLKDLNLPGETYQQALNLLKQAESLLVNLVI